METKLCKERPVFTTNYSNGESIEIYAKDVEKIMVDDEMSSEDWYPNVNATQHTYETLKCIYKDESGILLRRNTEIIVDERNYSGTERKVELVWLELTKSKLHLKEKTCPKKANSEKEDI